MPLIKNIKQVREHLPVSATDNNASVPTMQAVSENEYLLPVLGSELFDALQDEADQVPFPATPSDLMAKVMPAAVLLAYYKELPFLHTRITNTGLKNVTTDSQQGAYRYQYEALLQECESIGLMHLEILFSFLMKKKDDPDYADWKNSEAYARLNKNLIKTGAEFKTYFTIHQPHRTFYALQPVMQEVEDLYIKKSIGSEFFDSLKDLDNPSDEEKYLIDLLKKSIANLTVHKACSKLTVRIGMDGFTVALNPASDQYNSGQSSASEKNIALLRQDTERDGNNFLNDAKIYLDKKANASVFPLYFDSEYYTDRSVAVKNINDSMNGVYAL